MLFRSRAWKGGPKIGLRTKEKILDLVIILYTYILCSSSVCSNVLANVFHGPQQLFKFYSPLTLVVPYRNFLLPFHGRFDERLLA